MENNEIIQKILEEYKEAISKPDIIKYESENLNELFGALAKAQSEMEMAKEENYNPFFKSKYANLKEIVKASRPYLARNGLSVIQRVLPNGNGQFYLSTRLAHLSGQWIDSKMPITPPKSDIQSLGSYISYLRRYTYAAIVGVVSSDDDDDGEKAMDRTEQQKTLPLSKEEIQEIENLLEKLPEEREKVLKWCQVRAIKDIHRSKFDALIKNLKAKLKMKDSQ